MTGIYYPDLELLCRGCETWIVREGYEGLVRGNSEAEDAGQTSQASELNVQVPTARAYDPTFTQNLRFGDGRLLRDGTADFISEGRSLQGRYIVRVGWDDVRSWLAEVCIHLCYRVHDTYIGDSLGLKRARWAPLELSDLRSLPISTTSAPVAGRSCLGGLAATA